MKEQIEKDLKIFKLLKPVNPMYDYYRNKLISEILSSEENGIISKEDGRAYTIKRQMYEDSMKESVFYSVYAEYKRFESSGMFLIEGFNFEDVMLVKGVCEGLSKFNDPGYLNEITSDKALSESLSSCYKKLENYFTDLKIEDMNKIYTTLLQYYRCCISMMNRPIFESLYKEFFGYYINWSNQLLEINKEYYYTPNSITSSEGRKMAFSTSFSNATNSNEYTNYYKEKYRLKILEGLVIGESDRSFSEIENSLLAEVENLDLSTENKYLIKANMLEAERSAVSRKYSVIEVLYSFFDGGVENIVYYPRQLLVETLVFCLRFISTFSKEFLLKHCLQTADVKAHEESIIGSDTNIAFDMILEGNLDILLECDQITPLERKTFFEQYRRCK